MGGKLDISELERRLESGQGPEYWRSLDELDGSEQFLDHLHREFLEGASEWRDLKGRRRFLQIMGASLALAGVQGCISGPPQEEILPYVVPPEDVVPGKPQFYATSFPLMGYGQGVLVESHEARPTKIEGNPDHPASLGATTVFAQASVLDLYDPDRSTTPLLRGRSASLDQFASEMQTRMGRLERNGGEGLRLLTETVTSPTLEAQLAELFDRFPNAKWHRHDPTNGTRSERGLSLVFDRPVRPVYRIEEADVVLSLDSDFLFALPGSVRYARKFAERRRVRSGSAAMNRLYAIEGSTTITGAMADHRLPLAPSEIDRLIRMLASRIGAGLESFGSRTAYEGWVNELVFDLVDHPGRSLVIAGESLPPAVHALVHHINERLGNDGRTVEYVDSPEVRPAGGHASLASLVADMTAGRVDTLVMLGGNPAYTAPADVAFADALRNVPASVHLSRFVDETSFRSVWHLPATHYLEEWSDLRAFDGSVGIVQPLIAPLYDSARSAHEVLAMLMGRFGVSGHELVRASWSGAASGWEDILRAGVVPNSGLFTSPRSAAPDEAGAAISITPTIGAPPAQEDEESPEEGPADEAEVELVFAPDPTVWDGSFSNNAWLQELPKPITKLCWDNAVLIAPSLAERLGLENGDVVELTYESHVLEGAAWVVPGHPRGTVSLTLGYGRSRAGAVGSGAGYNAYLIRTSGAPHAAPGARLRRGGRSERLVSTQHHHSMEGRKLVEEADIERFRSNPDFLHEAKPLELPSLYPEYAYDGYKWGMVVDLNTCIGCNACIVACQSENNIPVVGKDEVGKGRQMHWLRVDRYYKGPPSNPEAYFQPVPCMHCEKAPCEVVCPVYATVHDEEGLNVMIYNRCIGTRYCSNNCPYKVRRFNFLKYADWSDGPSALQRNPNVTVRSRGVMEKCTYCIQRISAARIRAKREDRSIRDGEVLTACQMACPTEAIAFGDLNDEGSVVHAQHAEPHNYKLLHELGTQPRTSYLAHFRNPNVRMPEVGSGRTIGQEEEIEVEVGTE